MAKEVAISKRVKISKAQQNMIIMVVIASVVLGVMIALTVHFIKQIAFNARVISEEEAAIVSYSEVIESVGICKSPKGDVYSKGELDKCDPNSIEISEIPGTLRSDILVDLAANEALNSVPKEVSSSCIDPETGKNYTYKKMEDIYEKANGASELAIAEQLIKSCSALRIIPDALPAFRNEEALLASLNKIFLDSGWQPESISPGSSKNNNSDSSVGLNVLPVNLAVKADASTTMNVLGNIERSIREFDIGKASIEWGSDSTLSLNAQATAYYIDRASIAETTNTVRAEGK